ncbi:endolytic transglycosylase MltG [Bacillus massilinigeriensis]|uniref:endolytic transglycosylase MltG n=1 Tax=Bacillus massilionigeriensis TaxID=1805475 RepID=UPI00096B24B7|nr:endolytic transglycosylase MltG [Bacillus massilionigeriensis]
MTLENKNEKKEYIRQKMLEKQGEAKVVRKIVLIVTIAIFIIAGSLTLGGYIYIKSALKPLDKNDNKNISVEIPIGSSTSGIAQILEDKGVIKNAHIFKYYVKFRNESGFMAGEYKLKPSMTLPQIINRLKTGKLMEKVVFKMTIPEGKQLDQIADIIAEKTNRDPDEIFKQLNDKKYIKSLMDKYPSLLTEEILDENIKYPLEGYLFPATYPFYKENPTLDEMVTYMLDKTSEVINEQMGLMEKKKLTAHEVLTMASLIEEEATEKVDRDQISSVFYNRLKLNMPLQTDPTVLYAQGKHKERVVYKDLEVDDPYNTYKNVGLTPGPISNAGEISIEAAINPAKTDFLYFLATADGEVLFSKTLDEHNDKKAQHITKNEES